MAYGTILHINAVGLAAAVEQQSDRSLKWRPFVVANEDLPRAVVLDVSPEAHKEGLQRGMVLSAARALCPHLVVRRPRPNLYASMEEVVRGLCLRVTPLVEAAGRGHLYMDLAGTCRLYGQPEDVAQKLRADIYESTGLTPSMALSGTKTVSKVATRVFRPSGFVALSSNEASELLQRQPVNLLPGVGPVLQGRLSLLAIEAIGDLAALSAFEAKALGPRGKELVTRAQGYDASPVNPENLGQRKATADLVFEPDTEDPEALRAALVRLVTEVAFSLRKDGLGAQGATVLVQYTDGAASRATQRAKRLCVRDGEVLELALGALKMATKRRVRIRRLALVLSELNSAGPELDLFEPEVRQAHLQYALDRVHERFGFAALVPCICLATQRLGV